MALYIKDTLKGSISGNAGTATTLQTARTINGTSFNGSANITTSNWGTARTLTIGSTGKSVNGSGNVSWTLAEIGAAPTSHGNHVPTTQTASNSVFLRNDNTWQTVTPTNIGAASTSPLSNTSVKITVEGDANTYYPVLITMNRPGIGYPYYKINISRAYNATAPDTWNTSTHRGGLTFSFRWSGDTGWGGNDHAIRVDEFAENYCTMVAGFTLSVNGIIVWLRGGTADYQLNCEQGLGIKATVTLGTYTAADDKTYPARTDTSNVANEIYKKWHVRQGGLYDNNNRVYSASNKPTAADIGAAASSHTHSYLPLSGGTMTGKITTPNNAAGITIGDDVTICDRNVANFMVLEGSTATSGGIIFGSGKDTNIYRGGANILKTDDAFQATSVTVSDRYYVSSSAGQTQLGVGDSDCYWYNQKAGKYFQFKNDGRICLSDSELYHRGHNIINVADRSSGDSGFGNSSRPNGFIGRFPGWDSNCVYINTYSASGGETKSYGHVKVKGDYTYFDGYIFVQGKRLYIQADAPGTKATGDIWIDI